MSKIKKRNPQLEHWRYEDNEKIVEKEITKTLRKTGIYKKKTKKKTSVFERQNNVQGDKYELLQWTIPSWGGVKCHHQILVNITIRRY